METPSTETRKRYAVWEITLKCNLACRHCGSRAGGKRDDELSTDEALDLVRQMAEVGVHEVTLIGGEAYLRKDWLQIAAAVKRHGMRCTLQTGGLGITDELARRMAEAGIDAAGVSIDGLEETHDWIRGKPGSHRWALEAMRALRRAGIRVTANTQINRRSIRELPLVYEQLRDAGMTVWQIQATVPMGNAAEEVEMLLQPAEFVDVFPVLALLSARGEAEGVRISAGNNLGYFGPYERTLRNLEGGVYRGCTAGTDALGIEANGAVKGCPSLPSGPYTGGNVREKTLREIVERAPELRFNEGADSPAGTDHLWGFCQGCEFAAACRGGCTWASHVFFNRRGNNPYCHHRALVRAAEGKRERVYLRMASLVKRPFDFGTFGLREEDASAPWPEGDPWHFTLEQVRWPAAWLAETPDLPRLLADERDDTVAYYRRRYGAPRAVASMATAAAAPA
ncbi:MAG: radical SAM protein [Polyangiales bacterium]